MDVNGLNLRASSKDQAALVLQHAGNSINMKVQFNPGDYHSMLTLASSHEDERVNDEDDHEDSSEESESEDDDHDEVMSSSHRHSIRAANPNNSKQEKSRSGSPTPRNR